MCWASDGSPTARSYIRSHNGGIGIWQFKAHSKTFSMTGSVRGTCSKEYPSSEHETTSCCHTPSLPLITLQGQGSLYLKKGTDIFCFEAAAVANLRPLLQFESSLIKLKIKNWAQGSSAKCNWSWRLHLDICINLKSAMPQLMARFCP